MKIGFIGAGQIGGNLARLAMNAGREVFISNSRNPRTLFTLLGQTGPKAKGGTAKEAATFADLIVVAIPFYNCREVPVKALEGKVVIDTNNHLFERDGHVPEIESGGSTGSELLATHLKSAKVVRAFSSILSTELVPDSKPAGAPERRALPIAGDDKSAKSVASKYISELGFDSVDFGNLNQGRRFERGSALFGAKHTKSQLEKFAKQ
jgi:8-hydroxy-5-deazaflavin:NADPH oxidoreductase